MRMTSEREMTLDEWMKELPSHHAANCELVNIRAELEEVQNWHRELCAEYKQLYAERDDWRDLHRVLENAQFTSHTPGEIADLRAEYGLTLTDKQMNP